MLPAGDFARCSAAGCDFERNATFAYDILCNCSTLHVSPAGNNLQGVCRDADSRVLGTSIDGCRMTCQHNHAPWNHASIAAAILSRAAKPIAAVFGASAWSLHLWSLQAQRICCNLDSLAWKLQMILDLDEQDRAQLQSTRDFDWKGPHSRQLHDHDAALQSQTGKARKIECIHATQ